MYLKHWKLQRDPFTTAFEAELVLFHKGFAEAYYSLSLASKIAPDTFWLVGAAGVGKTTLLRCLEESVRGEVGFVAIPGAFLDSRVELLEKLRPEGAPAGPAPPESAADALGEHFLQGPHAGRTLVVAIDDADAISDEAAVGECLKLYGLGRRHGRPLTVVFTGRKIPPVFEASASHPAQTLALPTPDLEQARSIVEHRLRLCGTPDEIFTDAALETIASLAAGNVARLLPICNLCLQEGFVERRRVIDANLIREKVEPFVRRFFEEAARRDEPAEPRGPAEPAEAWGGSDVYHTLSSRQRGRPQAEPQPGDRRHFQVLSPPKAGPPAEDAAEIDSGPAAAEAGRDKLRLAVPDGSVTPAGGDRGGRRSFTPALQTYLDGNRPARPRPPAEEPAPPSPGLEEPPAAFRDLPAGKLYDAGVELIREVLARLRKLEFVDLDPLRRLAGALAASTAADAGLIRSAIGSSGEYCLDAHLLNVAILAVATGRKLDLGDEDLATLGEIALLHDVGHLQIGEKLLYSENRFDREDFATIKQHPRAGYELIRRQMNGSELVADVILQEHERDDGLGYPNYLSGDQIHLYAKIIGVCDVFEALTHTRAHRRELTPAEALVEINATMRRRTAPRIIVALMAAVRPALKPQ